MAQKDKVKELVGRGLDSYHTKSLQQMDRIEKKNKEQNHKISILSNELDNDYLTKTEEGSVVSLEYSKEGMVYLDELQGNTLVNYCTDGSKEMTLNGDIDVEGVSVTTTEGVDNGLVDVICEGNTLVNIIDGRWYNGTTETKNNRECFKITKGSSVNHLSITNIKSGVPYTLIYDYASTELIRGTNNPFGRLHLTLSNESGWVYDVPAKNFESNKSSFVTSISVFTIPTHIQFSSLMITGTLRDIEGTVWLDKNILLLEGDWSNKEIPKYFKGMKSVGECEDNKIEILSQNKNLFDKNKLQVANGSLYGYMYLGENDNYTLSITDKDTSVDMSQVYFGFTKNGKNAVEGYHWLMNNGSTNGSTNLTRGDFPYFSFFPNDSTTLEKITSRFNIQIEKGIQATSHIPCSLNKKEILINEPLRKINDTYKDKFVKIGGKLFIERNCVGKKLQVEKIYGKFPNILEGTNYTMLSLCVNELTNMVQQEKGNILLCDKLPTYDRYPTTNFHHNCLVKGNTYIGFVIDRDNFTNNTDDEYIEYINSLNVEIVYPVSVPMYEPLEIEPTLNTYADITHISNNSIIPCNMKIKNSGYNVIIKPSTLYTVALDTNKSGTIGMNLGGAKGTTTNNVTTITTPATLVDDSLRLYGKGIKGSKVRLLEGDKTNLIPSFFEGMKSSFEDKVQEDGKYRIDILSHTTKLQNQLLNPNLKTHPFPKTTVEGDWDVFEWKVGDYFLSSKIALDREKYHQNDKIYIRFDVVKLSDALYPENEPWCGRLEGYGMHFYKGADYNSLPLNQQRTLSKIMSHTAPDTDPRPFKLDFGIYSRTLECKFKIKDVVLVNLTMLYGKGNEPTVEWCDENIPYYTDNEMYYIDMNKIQFSSIEPLRSLPNGVKDKFIFKDNKLMIERNTRKTKITSDMNFARSYEGWANIVFACEVDGLIPIDISTKNVYCNILPSFNIAELCNALGKTGIASHDWVNNKCLQIAIKGIDTVDKLREWISERDMEIVYQIEPTYEEVPFELQKIILEGYENGTLFFDTNIPPTSTVTYAGETPIVKATKLNKTEVLNNTNDINDNIIPYLMDMDYRVVMLQLATEELEDGVSMARLFGGTYEMIKRDILSKRLSRQEYGYRLADYFNAGKLTEEQVRELEELR